jgi:hypothetical protein
VTAPAALRSRPADDGIAIDVQAAAPLGAKVRLRIDADAERVAPAVGWGSDWP